MEHHNQKPIVALIAVKVLLLVAFLLITQTPRTASRHTITIGNPPFTECERTDVVAEYHSPALQMRGTL